MEITNTVRQRVWKQQPKGFLSEALIDTDGTMAPTFGECKGGMALSYKGIWGYAPLVVTLANTGEVLYLVNRPGNVVSHEGCVPWICEIRLTINPAALVVVADFKLESGRFSAVKIRDNTLRLGVGNLPGPQIVKESTDVREARFLQTVFSSPNQEFSTGIPTSSGPIAP
jgi:hypothetical protein